jgi:hypothetical protein
MPALYYNIVEGFVYKSHKVVISYVIQAAAYLLECNYLNRS